jgi:phosphopantothenoylcysteine decarboxylase / phosphopantothenate---cysteine ligase
LGRQGPLAGTHIVVTAGGTQEPLDLVRFVGNRSSGRMGFAIAQAAIDAGAAVTLIAGPTSLTAPYGSTYIAVNTAIEMKGAVDPALKGADALVMAAAVADYRPSDPRQEKVKKSQAGESLNTEFVANPDILASAQGNGLLKIGFAAETSNLIENAWAKIGQKGLDLIIANDAQSSIGSRDTTVTLVWPNGSIESLPRMRKEELAEILICRITDLLQRH